MSKIEVNTVAPQCGTTLTLGENNDTVVLGTGAAFGGGVGAVKWETTPQTGSFGALAGRGYFMNTTSGPLTLTLPASPSAGDIVAVSDYALTFNTNNLTIDPGTNKIEGDTTDYTVSSEGKSLTLVYTDSTQGWKVVNDGNSTAGSQASFVVATGGTVTCCGDYKIHTFTGPGTFTVSCAGNPAGSDTVDYLVVAGGGAGGGPFGGDSAGGGGGGAGGFRLSNDTCMPAPLTSPLANPTGITVTATSFPITVGAGGTANGNPPGAGGCGSNSTFSTIISTGGGGGGAWPVAPAPLRNGQPGGSGGGASRSPAPTSGGTGNTPPVSPPQGNNGGSGNQGAPNYGQGGGGGAGAVANTVQNATTTAGGNGGIGSFVVSSGFAGCNGTPGPVCGARYFAGGGGGATYQGGTAGPGGAGGGGAGNFSPNFPSSPGISGVSGGTNTGGGGGGMSQSGSGGAGGSGIVIIRYKFQ